MTWDDLRVLAVFTAISYAIAWIGTFLINLVRAPKLLYDELLAGKAQSPETAPMPLVALLYDNPGWERTKWFIRNHGSLSAFGVTVAPIDVGNYRAVFARIPELPPTGKRTLLDFNVTVDGRATQDHFSCFWEMLLESHKTTLPVVASFSDIHGRHFKSRSHLEINISTGRIGLFFDGCGPEGR